MVAMTEHQTLKKTTQFLTLAISGEYVNDTKEIPVRNVSSGMSDVFFSRFFCLRTQFLTYIPIRQ